MRCIRKYWFLLLVSSFLLTPSSAHAQVIISRGAFGGLGFGNFGNFGGFGGLGYPGVYGLNPYGMNPYGWNSGFGGPYGGMAGMPYNYNPGYSSPYYSSGWGPTTPILVPGFAASDPVRTRPMFYPAISEPAREVIAAALDVEDKNRARIEMHVPSANAKVYLDGVLTKQTGLDRMFVTPKLNPASRYSLNVEIVWQTENGRSRTLKRPVNLRAGETANLDLRDPE